MQSKSWKRFRQLCNFAGSANRLGAPNQLAAVGGTLHLCSTWTWTRSEHESCFVMFFFMQEDKSLEMTNSEREKGESKEEHSHVVTPRPGSRLESRCSWCCRRLLSQAPQRGEIGAHRRKAKVGNYLSLSWAARRTRWNSTRNSSWYWSIFNRVVDDLRVKIAAKEDVPVMPGPYCLRVVQQHA